MAVIIFAPINFLTGWYYYTGGWPDGHAVVAWCLGGCIVLIVEWLVMRNAPKSVSDEPKI